MNNYNHFDDNLDIEFVSDFTREHVANCFCALGSTTSLLFNLSQNYIPIIYLFDCGYNHYEGLDIPKNWIKVKHINNLIYKKILKFKITKKFNLIC
jgi:hypothetical protein